MAEVPDPVPFRDIDKVAELGVVERDESSDDEAEPKELLDRIDELPDEVQSRIFEFAGNLTRLLQGQLAQHQPLTRAVASLVVADTFRLDSVAVAKVALLPRVLPGGWEPVFIRSPRMAAAARSHFGQPADWTAAAASASALSASASALAACFMQAIADLGRSHFPLIRDAIDAVPRALMPSLDPAKPAKILFAELPQLRAAFSAAAAATGHLAIAPTLKHPSITSSLPALEAALRYEQTEMIKYLMDQIDADTPVLAAAFKFGNIELAQAAVARFPQMLDTLPSNALLLPLKNNNTEIITWLLKAQPDWQHAMFADLQDYCAAFGHHELLQLAVDNNLGNPVSSRAMDLAAEHGRLDCVIWLHECRKEGCTTAAMDKAAENGHLDIVEYLHKHRTEGATVAAINKAASNGHIAVVRFLAQNRTEGCTEFAFSFSASNHHVEVLQFLLQTYPHIKPKISNWTAAINTNRFFVLSSYLDHSHPGQDTLDALLKAAWTNKRYLFVDWLVSRHHAKPNPSMMEDVAKSGDMEAAYWLHEHLKGGYGETALMNACINGHVPMVKFLLLNGSVDVTTEMLQSAPLNVVQYLFETDVGTVDWNWLHRSRLTSKPVKDWLEHHVRPKTLK